VTTRNYQVMTIIVEQWKPVPGYEGLYEVSDQGRVKSLPGSRWNGHAIHYFKGRVLKPQSKLRYLQVTLSKNGKIKSIKIHQLVAEAFLPTCPGVQGKLSHCYQIDHINNNSRDNRASNLQWLTRYENGYIKANRSRNRLGQFV
jgi:hypothetical protein